MLQEDEKTRVNHFSLKFCNSKTEKEFTEATFSSIRNHNIWISSICSILALTMTIVYSIQYYKVNEEGRKENLSIEKITNNTLIDMIQNNQSSISQINLIKDKYLLVNNTKMLLGYSKEQSLISVNSSYDSVSFINSSIFLSVSMISSGIIFVIYIIFLIWAFRTKNDKYHKFIFCLTKLLFSQSFHTISGAMIIHFKFNAENVYFVISMQLLLIILLIYSFHVSWYLFFLGTFISNISEWLIYKNILSLTNTILIYYLITNSLIHLNCVIIAYLKEKKFRSEYYLQILNNKQRKYAVELIYKMDQGFISYIKDKNNIFFNNSMKNIINSFKDKARMSGDEKISDLPSREFPLAGAGLPTVQDELISIRNDDQVQNQVQNQIQDLQLNLNNYYYNPYLLHSNTRPSGKLLVDKLLNNLTNLNSQLPEDILLLFNGNIENILDVIYEKVKKIESFSSFTYLGVITVKNESNQNSQTKRTKNIKISKEKISVKYQIMFRVVNYDSEESYLELMFQDVSEVVKLEMEKAILNTRSLYLSKIAHEFKNPITSILELTSNVKELCRDKEENCQEKIIGNVDYIEDLCGGMSQFLNDFSLFTNLKFSCDSNCGLNFQKNSDTAFDMSNEKNQHMISLDTCPSCSSISPLYCKKCKICLTCENNNKTIFNSINLIKKLNRNFRKLYRNEKGIYFPNLLSENFLNFCVEIPKVNLQNSSDKVNSRVNCSLIKADKKLLESALYNLIFHAYRSTAISRGETSVVVTCRDELSPQKEEIILTKFEIFNSKLHVDTCFIEFLQNSKGIKSQNKAENPYLNSHFSNSDKFNKYFELYVAFNFIKKLNSELSISSGKDGTLISFTLNTNKIDIENFQENHEEEDFIQDCSREDLNQTVVLSISKKLMEKPGNIVIRSKNSTCSILSNFSYNNYNNHPKIMLVEPQIKIQNLNVESIYKTPETEKRILLIDDEPLIRKTLKKHLTNIFKNCVNEINLTCEEASNCFEAIDILYKNFINNVKFDIIIIDEFMPFMKGSSFIKLFKQLQHESNFYEIKIISYTAFDSEEKKKLIFSSGADQIINKPISYNDFKKVILSLM